MTSVYIDTSAFIAVLDADDRNHQKARKIWEDLIDHQDILISSNYILIETIALIQNRLGIQAVRDFQNTVIPLLTIDWVNETIHNEAIMGVLTAGQKSLSFVDCISFQTIRRLGIQKVFTFDKHFKAQGLACLGF